MSYKPNMKGWTDKQKAEYKKSKEKFDKLMAQTPTISDEEFMRMTEVSDEEYGIGVGLPATRK
ncbi:hypothetical protein N8198_09660 [Gammaproteobacteria bacterium]|nr:hypothetical protein [Gammaproteobacteria bacterium]